MILSAPAETAGLQMPSLSTNNGINPAHVCALAALRAASRCRSARWGGGDSSFRAAFCGCAAAPDNNTRPACAAGVPAGSCALTPALDCASAGCIATATHHTARACMSCRRICWITRTDAHIGFRPDRTYRQDADRVNQMQRKVIHGSVCRHPAPPPRERYFRA